MTDVNLGPSTGPSLHTVDLGSVPEIVVQYTFVDRDAPADVPVPRTGSLDEAAVGSTIDVVVVARLSARAFRRLQQQLRETLGGRRWRLTRPTTRRPRGELDALVPLRTGISDRPERFVVVLRDRPALRHVGAIPRLLTEVAGGRAQAVEASETATASDHAPTGPGDLSVYRIPAARRAAPDVPAIGRPGLRVPLRSGPPSTRGVGEERRGGAETAPGAEAAVAPLDVLVLTSEAPPVISGISTTVANLERGLTARGHRVKILSRNDFPKYMRREFRLSSFALFWPQVRRHLASFDVVNVHGPVPTMSEAFLALATSLGPNRPAIVYTHHSDLAIPNLERWCRTYNDVTGRMTNVADAVVVSSRDYATKVRRHYSGDVRVVPWGVDSAARVQPRPARDPHGPLRVLFVGQMRTYKGIDVLVEAVRPLTSVRLDVIGSGPLSEAVAQQVAQGGLDHVHLLGRVSDAELWTAYAEHDVIVLPSTTTAEAYGLVLLEGMASGCVPVASDLPGVREVAGPTGRLVRPGDVHSLRRVLQELAADQEEVTRLGRASVELAASRSVDATAEGYERAFAAAVARTLDERGRRAVPPPWTSVATFLAEVQVRTGRARISLVLVPPAATTAFTVWRPGAATSRVTTAAISAHVAKGDRPLVISPDRQVPFAVRMVLDRGDTTSAVLVPVHHGPMGTTVLCVSSEPGDEPLTPQQVAAVLDLNTGQPPAAEPRAAR